MLARILFCMGGGVHQVNVVKARALARPEKAGVLDRAFFEEHWCAGCINPDIRLFFQDHDSLRCTSLAVPAAAAKAAEGQHNQRNPPLVSIEQRGPNLLNIKQRWG